MSTGTVYIVKPREESGVTASPRLVRAARRSSVESYVLQSFSIEKASPDECVSLGSAGKTIEETGE